MIATQEQTARQQWLATRNSFIGSSESPAILGCGYADENAHTVWSRKLGMAEEREDDDRLLCGRLLQDGICKIIRHKTGYDIRPADEFEVHRSEEYPYIGCSPDSKIFGDPRGLGICELKNVDHYLLRDWKGSDPPLRVAVQLQHQLLAVGATWGICAAVIGGNRPVWFELELHARLIDAMIPKLREFWRCVETRTMPEVDGTENCRRALAAAYPEDNGTTIALPAEDGAAWFDELTALKRLIKHAEARKDLIENKVKAAIGAATKATLPDGRCFTWKAHNCDGYYVEPTTKRPLLQRGGDKTKDDDRLIARISDFVGLPGKPISDESEGGE